MAAFFPSQTVDFSAVNEKSQKVHVRYSQSCNNTNKMDNLLDPHFFSFQNAFGGRIKVDRLNTHCQVTVHYTKGQITEL